MLGFLAVVTIYAVGSFAGMAFLWTIAAKAGRVQAPSFFFWMHPGSRRDMRGALVPPHELEMIPLNRSRGLDAEKVYLRKSLAGSLDSESPQVRTYDKPDQDPPNQKGDFSAMSCSA